MTQQSKEKNRKGQHILSISKKYVGYTFFIYSFQSCPYIPVSNSSFYSIVLFSALDAMQVINMRYLVTMPNF